MKKKRLFCALALLTAVCILTTSSGFASSTEYNDKYYQTYGNLDTNSAVPSLFKNDDVFANYKNYPPVISDGIEYVPLELFYGLSNVKINYSDDNSNFYIQNKVTNEYVSFNISDSYAVTGQNKVYDTSVPTYYGVHYVPLRVVCDAVSIGCSTYNDSENKVYAIEIYTGAKSLSAQELLHIHAPELYSTETKDHAGDINDGTGDNSVNTKPKPSGSDAPTHSYIPENPYANTGESFTGGSGTGETGQTNNADGANNDSSTETQNGTQKEDQKESEYKRGTVMLFYTPENFANAEKTLDSLDVLGIKAVFFVTESDILGYPDTIRRIYTSGHTIGITFSEDKSELFLPGVFEEKAISAENALYEVAKLKTRLVYLGETGKVNEISKEMAERVEAMGLSAIKLNGDAKTDKLNPTKAGEKMRNDLRDIRRTFGKDTAMIRLTHTDSAISAAGAIKAICITHREVKTDLFDETDIRR